MGSTMQPSRIMISLEVASMVGGGPGRWRVSVRDPVKKTAKKAEVFFSHFDWAVKAKAMRAKRDRADSVVEKSR